MDCKQEQEGRGKYSRIQRCATETEKQSEELQLIKERALFEMLDKAVKEKTAQRKNDPTIKVISYAKKTDKKDKKDRRDKVLSQGRLYDQIANLCDLRGELNSQVSMMKRTYNLKKIQKMLS